MDKRSSGKLYNYLIITMVVQSWTDVVVGSLQNLWWGVVNYVPNLIGALVVLVVGLIVAAGLGALVEKILEGIRLDMLLEKIGLEADL